MLRSLWLCGVYFAFLGIGTVAPFVLVLGYVWVDTFRPQEVTYFFLNEIPVALILGTGAIVGYVAMDRRSPPPPMASHVLIVVMAMWVTTTMLWAVAPEPGWVKWDWAFKAIAFAAFIPFAIRSRIQIEAFVQVYVLSLAANFLTFGVKTLISGGGYGTNLGLLQGNGGLAEGGFLSTVCLMVVPLTLFLAKHATLVPRHRMVSLGYLGMAFLATLTAIGTYQRSALIGLLVLGAFMFVKTQHKFLFGLVGIVGLLALAYLTSDAWNSRISTIGGDGLDGSTNVRILVWKWTLEFVASNPLGGGFMAFLINHVVIPATPGSPGGETQFGRAFHSIYFEVLGEHGWPGLTILLLIIGSTLFALSRLKKRNCPGTPLACPGRPCE
jgi:probable O-glycosylation ligase (exosortase A-associated)